MSRRIDEIAVEALRAAVAWEPNAKLLGDVTAVELARLALPHITQCPACGSEAWVNIDCPLCVAVGGLESPDDGPVTDRGMRARAAQAIRDAAQELDLASAELSSYADRLET